MKLLFLILSKTEKIDELLSEFARKRISGATVIEGRGMVKMLSQRHDEDEIPILASLRSYLNPERAKNYIVLAVIRDELLQEAVQTIEEVIGDLSAENTGVVFSVPIDFTRGISEFGK